MSSQTTTQSESRQTSGQRGGKRGKANANRSNRGRGSNKPAAGQGDSAVPTNPTPLNSEVSKVEANPEEEKPVCWICAEPVKYYSVPGCNHRTCHVCALRLRALYKKMDCTFCKEPQPTVIFTESPDALFLSFTPESIQYKDSRLSIFFETQEMMEETLLLLRFNCPDSTCDYIGSGWGDLRLHVRASHGKLMCDLCIRSKKVFAHEHALYSPNHLHVHLPSMAHRPPKNPPAKKDIEGGIHPLCEFCRECFFSDDELYSHMRERHEECFICKRNEVRDQYFKDYNSLEKHFTHAHHPCNQPSCLAQKFVVFNSAMDLKAHTVDVHGGDMTARDKREALRLQAEFEFEDAGGGGGRRGGRRGGPPERERDREREPPPPTGPVNGGGAGGRRRQGFGGNLTVDGGAQSNAVSSGNTTSNNGTRRTTPELTSGEVDPEVAERHAAFIARLQSLARNPTTAIPSVKMATRAYRSHESSARDLISTIWNVLEQRLESTASIVNAFVDILDDEELKMDLLASWKGFEVEQRRQFPDLSPATNGSGYAGIASGRVLNVKHTSGSRSSQQSSRQVQDRVAQAASSSTATLRPGQASSSRFPPLQAIASPSPGPAPVTPAQAYRQQGTRATPWSASARATPSASAFPPPSASVSSSSTPAVRRPTPHAPRAPPPKLNSSLFPELPTSSNTRAKPVVSGNTSLKNILGTNGAGPAQPAWKSTTSVGLSGATAGTSATDSAAVEVAIGEVGNAAGGGKKKGKGKQKQTLFTLGAFPT